MSDLQTQFAVDRHQDESPREYVNRLLDEGRYEEAENYLRVLTMMGLDRRD